MDNNEGVVEFIREGGFGSEASVRVELRTKFPGIGGTIITNEGVVTALREEFGPAPLSGHRMFLRHTIIKKVEDYFFRKGLYVFAHIPRPLGSISERGEHRREAYLYEWAVVSDAFPWEFRDRNGNVCPVRLRDWNEFTANFAQAGIDVAKDCSSSDDGRISQNIIHNDPSHLSEGFEMSSLWKRIDFGYKSVDIDSEKLTRFLCDNREDLIRTLKSERYEMILLALQYLTRRETMKGRDIGKLEMLIGDYRRSSLTHFAMGLGPTGTPPYFGQMTDSLEESPQAAA